MEPILAESDWKTLLTRLERNTCIVLVGSGLGAEFEHGNRRSLAANLVNQMQSDWQQGNIVEPGKLPLVAEMFERRFSRELLELEVRDFYIAARDKLAASGSEDSMFTHLASLPTSLFISTRHDGMLEYHMQKAGRKFVQKWYAAAGAKVGSLGESGLGSVEQPLVYHLLGSIEELNSLAITESDLLNTLKAIASGNPSLPADLLNVLRNKSVLLLGCEIHEYYVRVLLHLLGINQSRQSLLALETLYHDEAGVAEQFRRSVWFYGIGYEKLKVIHSDHRRFLSELVERWKTAHPGNRPLAAQPVLSRSETPARRPHVFISYISEDEQRAGQLAQHLRERDIDIWMDKDALRGGERWMNALDDAIGNCVDFFILLLSEHLNDNVETFVHRELDRALERQKSRSSSMKFTYPVRIAGQGVHLDAIERAQIQVWNLRTLEGDVGDLAADIRKQFTKLQWR